MLHDRRTWNVTEAEGFLELGRELTERTHVCCAGYRLGSLLVLNDSTSENGAQEFAVVRDGRQVESLTCSWGATGEEIAAILERLDRAARSYWGENYESWTKPVEPRLDHPAGTCPACA